MDTPDQEPPSLVDRLIGAVVAAVCVGLTLLVVPILFSPRRSPLIRSLPWYSGTYFVWTAVVTAIAAIVGLRLGSLGTAELLGHLWGTATPPNPSLTLWLWLGIVVVLALTWLIAGW